MSETETMSEYITVLNYYRNSSYCIVAVATVVIYDWMINLSEETELIWKRKLTFVSWLYFICRYLSIICVIFGVLMTTTLPLSTMDCTGVSQAYSWSNFVVTVATHAMMVLRLYAMFYRSKAILVLLIATFIGMDVFNIIGKIPGSEHVGADVNPLLMYLCVEPNTWNYEVFTGITIIPVVGFGVFLIALALFGYYQHAADRKKNLGTWSANSWVNLLMIQNIIYCVVAGGCQIVLVASSYSSNQYNLVAFGSTLATLQNYILAPRMLLSFRRYGSRIAHSRDSSARSAFITNTNASTERLFQLPRLPSLGLGQDSRPSLRNGLGTWDVMTG